jgi:CRP-like cAMP-binding protein
MITAHARAAPSEWDKGASFRAGRGQHRLRHGAQHMNAMILKLRHRAHLSHSDEERLRALASERRIIAAHEDIIREGERPENIYLVLDGYACRYTILDSGVRSIMAYLLPGDICDLHVALLGFMDHSIGALTRCEVAEIPPQAIDDLGAEHPAIIRALWWSTLVDEAILRRWLVSMGRRRADQHLAHFFCELYMRMDSVERVRECSIQFPLTQEVLADTIGISAVHVNRVLQQLREMRLIGLHGKTLTIHDFDRLAEFAGFSSHYLHLKDRMRSEALPPKRDT